MTNPSESPHASTDVIRTLLISILMPAKMQLPEGVRGADEFLSEFSVPQGDPILSDPGERLGTSVGP